MKHYVILSEGAYSDYSPIYFIGDKQITKEQLKSKAIEIGDKVVLMIENKEIENYNGSDEFIKLMTEWVEENGFEKLPEDIPEINTCYGDFPTSTNQGNY